MTFVPVDELPEIDANTRRANRAKSHSHKDALDEFMKMNVRIAKVVYRDGEFVDWASAHSSLRPPIKRLGLPIDVCVRNHEVYLIRRDI